MGDCFSCKDVTKVFFKVSYQNCCFFIIDGGSVIKHLSSSLTARQNKLERLSSVYIFQASPIVESKTQCGVSLASIRLAWKKLSKDKHSSLFFRHRQRRKKKVLKHWQMETMILGRYWNVPLVTLRWLLPLSIPTFRSPRFARGFAPPPILLPKCIF